MKGVYINTKDRLGMTCLIWAASMGHEDTVKTLLNNGADVNAKDNDGWTALMWIEAEGCTEIVKLLQLAGAENKKVE